MKTGLWKLPALWKTPRTRFPQGLGKRFAFSTAPTGLDHLLPMCPD